MIAAAILACACLVIEVVAAAADDAPPTAENAPSVSEEAPSAAEEVTPESEEGSFTILDDSCSSGYVCAWNFVHFEKVKGKSLCTGGPHPLAGYKYSAKNRCANKKAFLKIKGTTIQTCTNPGGDRPLTEFNEVWIGAEGSRC